MHTDGQVQVLYDMLGLVTDFKPRHAGSYANLAPVIQDALRRYAADVKSGTFPTAANSFYVDGEPAEESGPPEPVRGGRG